MRRLPIHGRGAAGNPPNRFERIEVEREGWTEAEDPAPETRLLRDESRSVIATNESPDVGFEASVNPYRGCEHGCAYCLKGDTPVLMADGRTRPIADLRPGDRIFGTARRGHYRRYVKTRVLARWKVRRQAVRITLEDGTSLVAGRNHRFLTLRGWKFVTGTEQGRGRRPHFTPNDSLLGVGGFARGPALGRDYRVGYLCGMVRGDGHLGAYEYERPDGGGGSKQFRFRLALADGAALKRSADYLRDLGVETRAFEFKRATRTRRAIGAIRNSSRSGVDRVRRLVAWPGRPSRAWTKGFLAGIFDAEGSYSQGVLRISNSEPEILDRIVDSLTRLGLDAVLESRPHRSVKTVRIRGGLAEHLRFFHTTDPAIARKRDIAGSALKSAVDLRVRSIEPLEKTLALHDITTGTEDFIADGVVSHNCYARPTHEYLGFSAGLDFETKILVKEDAPALLREELADPSWEPKTLVMSGVTDPYQPVERRLGITRGCLEVLAEARNPVSVVTKSRLVLRDVDLLSELARHGAARVSLSVTTLDEELRRVMEPRAPTPEARLDAVGRLAEAGISVGVMVAPVIPGLTEHEIPRILEAAAESGAEGAAYVLLRLPHGLTELFEDWLSRHFPDRREKILNRLRSLRGGRLYDARFGARMRGEGEYAEQIADMFEVARRRAGLDGERSPLSTDAFRRPRRDGQQLDIFSA